MEKLILDLKNCYGIKKFEEELDFSSSNIFAVYAPNGAMKTSFAKTFQDLSKGLESKDLIFPGRSTVRNIKREDGSDLKSEEVFVMEPYNEDFRSEKISTLLVNKPLKKRYDEVLSKIDEEKERFLKELKTTSQFKGDLEIEISLTFTSREDEFFLSLSRLEKEVLDETPPEFPDIIYNEIFSDKIHEFLRTNKDFREDIENYIGKYEELINKSKYFKKGIFNHNNASTIAKSLMDNGFFKADHSVYLHSDGGNNEIRTKEELEKVIEEEKNSILQDPGLVKVFDEIDTKLKANTDLRRFRDYLAQNISVVPELKGARLNGFRQKLWVSYFKKHKDLYSGLLKEYHLGEVELKKIAVQANLEVATWLRVIDIFNKRFSVPFRVKVENQAAVILKQDVPSIAFEFTDSGGTASVGNTELLQVLSTGEKRALYILNIIFEVEARANNGQETVFIIDDVADSFDYKNKYAIIEYLRDISNNPKFYQIILTHNFDFYRTLGSRFIKREHCLMVEKSSTETRLVKASYIKNPFKCWMENLGSNDIQLLASIPFARNLIEYTKGLTDADYLILTSLLHFKTITDSIVKDDLRRIYNGTFSKQLNFPDSQGKILDLIIGLADRCVSALESVNLENKIILSMAIRLTAEKFMFSKIADKSEPTSNQTYVLFNRYKNEFIVDPSEAQKISILEQVNLMTPENIHLNSFMYEPILDMSDEHLRGLYQDVKSLS